MGLTQQEALDLFRSDDLVGIGMAAMEVRRRKTDPRVATYQIDRNINYTNFCTGILFVLRVLPPAGVEVKGTCSRSSPFYEKIEEMLELGGTGISLQGGLHPDLRIEYYENLLRSLKELLPASPLAPFLSAPEIGCIAEVSGLSVRETIAATHAPRGWTPSPAVKWRGKSR